MLLAVCLLTGCAGKPAEKPEEMTEHPQETEEVTLPGEYPKELCLPAGPGPGARR